MNKYEIRVNGAVILSQAFNEWGALEHTGLFKEIGEMVDFVRTKEPETRNFAWIYEVELNGQTTIAYIKRVG